MTFLSIKQVLPNLYKTVIFNAAFSGDKSTGVRESAPALPLAPGRIDISIVMMECYKGIQNCEGVQVQEVRLMYICLEFEDYRSRGKGLKAAFNPRAKNVPTSFNFLSIVSRNIKFTVSSGKMLFKMV